MTEKKKLTMRVCPTCGVTETEKEFSDFFCVDCQLKRQKVQLPFQIPKEIIILQCKNCGIHKIRRWYETFLETAYDIPSLFKGRISDVKVVSLSEKRAIVDYSFDGTVTTKEIPARIHRTLCNNCIKIARGYFESILQIRGDRAWVENIREMFERALHGTFISKVKEYKYGVDLYVGSTKATVQAIREMGLKAEKSARLHTAKEGRKLYRMTYLLRQEEKEEKRYLEDKE